MGIPSYFSYIIKNYTGIIRKLSQCKPFQHLMMDCNSIVYSAYAIVSIDPKATLSNVEKKIINETIRQIREQIRFVNPTKSVFIAFDGVAPLAKMGQQRVRRHKTSFTAKNAVTESLWDTTAITPGTEFMKKLNKAISKEFKDGAKEFGVDKFWISCSDEPGEGEHKLFETIRSQYEFFKSDEVAVYGLDSDLIMLAIFHLKFCGGIQVYREAPEFKTVLSSEFLVKERLFMNIGELSAAISAEMQSSIQQQMITVYDYIFMCFFLGNDFMPHFPAFNIRTHGIQILTDTYRLIIGSNPERSFVSFDGKIRWDMVKLFIDALAKQEHDHFLTEMATRDKMSNRQWTANTEEEKEQILQNLPLIYRGDEKYICPFETGWQDRYYSTLFSETTDISEICKNYLEGLEWVYSYYTNKCIDWRWEYKYHYPPLMSDLSKYMSHKKIDNTWQSLGPVSPKAQLAYVLPYSKLDLTGKRDELLKKFPEYYLQKYDFQWAFCRYFWEAHPILPSHPKELLDI